MALTKQQALEMLQSDDHRHRRRPSGRLKAIRASPPISRSQHQLHQFLHRYRSFCAFYRPIGAKAASIPASMKFSEKSKRCWAQRQRRSPQGGLHPDLQIDYYENLLRSIKQKFPTVHLHCFPRRKFSVSPKSANSA
jgi:cyclic dehypoxanthinyl futalosine synthase